MAESTKTTTPAATVFDKFQRMSFSGIVFPYKSYRVQGGIRKHTHEYPHNDGGVNEKLGRKLYEVHVNVAFSGQLTDKRYSDLLERLNTLRWIFQEQTTAKLVIPHIGEITAFAESWTETANNRNRSTIEAEIIFIEDSEEAFKILNPPDASKPLESALDTFNAEVLRNQLLLTQNTTNLFSLINSVASSILAFKDQADLYGSLVVAKIQSFTQILKDTDQQVKELNRPDFWPLIDAMQELWLASVQLQRDIERSNVQLRTYTTPLVMSVSQISSALFGDTSHAADIMQLNAFNDPLSVPAGFQVNYYYDPGIAYSNVITGKANPNQIAKSSDFIKTR